MAVQLLASVTVTKYTPAVIKPRSWVVALVLGPLHAYAYGCVPPLTVKSMDPVAVPGHNGLLVATIKLIAWGWVTCALVLSWHPPASVTVTV